MTGMGKRMEDVPLSTRDPALAAGSLPFAATPDPAAAARPEDRQ